jgi:hypothetical protein
MKKQITLSAFAYLLTTFPLAVVWHLVLFKETYETIGYIDGEPIFAFGAASMIVQAVVLSASYARLFAGRYSVKTALRFNAVAGVFYWSGHVVAYAAKGRLDSVPLFFGLETIYMALQFGIFGLCLGAIFAKSSQATSVATGAAPQ